MLFMFYGLKNTRVVDPKNWGRIFVKLASLGECRLLGRTPNYYYIWKISIYYYYYYIEVDSNLLLFYYFYYFVYKSAANISYLVPK